MTTRQLENRAKKLKELEAQQKELEQKIDSLKEEIKQEMEDRGAEEMQAGNFLIRWKAFNGSRFDAKTFQKEHESLYMQYLKAFESRRFTVA